VAGEITGDLAGPGGILPRRALPAATPPVVRAFHALPDLPDLHEKDWIVIVLWELCELWVSPSELLATSP